MVDEKKVREMLADVVKYIDGYSIVRHPRAELAANRCLQDVELYGVTSQHKITERLFACRDGRVSELTPKATRVRKKSYQPQDDREEEGERIAGLLTGDEEWVAILRSEFTTRPKGPHAAEKTLELYSAA
ncbi:MAG: hypothetical protein AB1714_28265 [Acidobacteriota bacterium]